MRMLQWLGGVLAFFVLPAFGLVAGVVAAFVYTYVFLDQDRTGSADIGTNLSFFGIAIVLGVVGVLGGLIGARKIASWAFSVRRSVGLITCTSFGEVNK